MIKRASSGRIVLIELKPASPVPLHRQVYNGLRARILDGTLRSNVPVPSSRALATELRVSRSTVILAYEQLRLEGYLQGRMGAATRVSASLPDRSVRASGVGAPPIPEAAKDQHVGTPSARAQAITAIPRRLEWINKAPRAFRAAVPAVDIFPIETWGRLLARRWRGASAQSLAYGDPFGYMPLREALVEYLAAARGVHCSAQQIMITNGALEGLDLTCRVVLDPGDTVWMEDPGYFAAHGSFAAAAARVVSVPVDADGLNVAEGVRTAAHARLAFVTPARQLPLGVTMSLARRVALIEWARANGSWIFEDDYDSEFRYAGRPLGALHGLDPAGSVIYAGTFSKVTFPALRLGYLVIPPALVDSFGAARYFMNYATAFLEQAALTDFITEGHFERHIRRARAVYQQRQELLVDQGARTLGGRMIIAPSDAGMTLIGTLPAHINDATFAAAARAREVDVDPISKFASRSLAPAVLLGYAGVCDWEIKEGVNRLAKALDDCGVRRRS